MITVSINNLYDYDSVLSSFKNNNINFSINDSCNGNVIITSFDKDFIERMLSLGKTVLVFDTKSSWLSKSNRKIFKKDNIYYCKSIDQLVNIVKYFESNKSVNRKLFILLFLILFFIVFTLVYFSVNRETKDSKDDLRYQNIVFLGDSITHYYNVNKYYKNISVVNSGVSSYTTDDIYNYLHDGVYIYNPTKIFLLIGTNDLVHDKDADYIVNRIYDIIDKIIEIRPNASIYLESIYPVNNTDDEKVNKLKVKDRDNKEIININKKLQMFCNNTFKCTYIDVYNHLLDKDGNLNLDYTEEGLHITDKGYKVITDVLKPYVYELKK